MPVIRHEAVAQNPHRPFFQGVAQRPQKGPVVRVLCEKLFAEISPVEGVEDCAAGSDAGRFWAWAHVTPRPESRQYMSLSPFLIRGITLILAPSPRAFFAPVYSKLGIANLDSRFLRPN